MTLAITFSPLAKTDLLALNDYFAEISLDLALRFGNAIGDALRKLAASHDLGGPCPFIDGMLSELRVWPIPKFANYLVFFRRTSSSLEVVRVSHGARNWISFFQ